MSEPDSPTRDGALRRGLRALLRWFDTADVESAATEPDRIDWLRVLPFIGMHLACLGVIWVGVIGFRAWRLRWRCTRCACSRSPASTTATSRTARSRRRARCSSCSRCSAPVRCSAGRCGGRRTIASPPQRGPRAGTSAFARAAGLLAQPHGLVPDPARLPHRLHLASSAIWLKYPELRWLDRFDILVPVALAVLLFLLGGWLETPWAPGLGTNAARSCWSGGSSSPRWCCSMPP
jgi:stearoyl-CoA desaturase (delta-9 desaturase)